MSAAIPPAYNAGKRKKEEAREWKDREKGRAERDKRDVRKQYMYICMHTWARKDAKEGGTHMELEPKYTTVEQCRHSHHSSMIQLWHA